MAIDQDIASAHDGPFGLRAAKRGATYRVTLLGEFDMAAVEPVREALEPAYAGDVEVLDVDLSQLSFLDSSGLRVLLEAHDRAREHDVELRLRRAVDPVQRVFAITGLETALPFVDEPCG